MNKQVNKKQKQKQISKKDKEQTINNNKKNSYQTTTIKKQTRKIKHKNKEKTY